jgi:hypothetical protein
LEGLIGGVEDFVDVHFWLGVSALTEAEVVHGIIVEMVSDIVGDEALALTKDLIREVMTVHNVDVIAERIEVTEGIVSVDGIAELIHLSSVDVRVSVKVGVAEAVRH